MCAPRPPLLCMHERDTACPLGSPVEPTVPPSPEGMAAGLDWSQPITPPPPTVFSQGPRRSRSWGGGSPIGPPQHCLRLTVLARHPAGRRLSGCPQGDIRGFLLAAVATAVAMPARWVGGVRVTHGYVWDRRCGAHSAAGGHKSGLDMSESTRDHGGWPPGAGPTSRGVCCSSGRGGVRRQTPSH